MLTRAELGISDSDFAVFAIGDLNSNKNHCVLIEAIAQLPDNVKLIIAGDGPLRGKLELLAKDLGISNRVLLLGFRWDIPALLNACDLFCLPSKREGLPVSLIEAMATGTPVLTSNSRGCADILGGLADKFIICEPSANSWSAHISLIAKDGCPVSVTALRERAAIFGIDSATISFASIYESVLSVGEGSR